MIAVSDDEGVDCEKECGGFSAGDAAVVRVASVQSVVEIGGSEIKGREVEVSAEALRGRVSPGHESTTVVIIVGVDVTVVLEVWLRGSGSRSSCFGRKLHRSEPKVLTPPP